MKQSINVKNIDQKESEELKKIYNHYVDKRKEIMKDTEFKVEDIFGEVINRETISPEQITTLNKFLGKIM